MSQHQNMDTTFTKIYVGGLPWTTRNEGLRSFFEQFGEIIHVNVVFDRAKERSQGYGFVTFKDAESATRACMNPNPSIDGRIANCKLASSGAHVNHNQSNQTSIRPDGPCYYVPSFWVNQHQPSNLPQPLTTNTGPYWNHHYPQHSPQYHQYPQHSPQYYQYPQHSPQYYHYPQDYSPYNPQYYSQYSPQYDPESYQQYPMVNTSPAYWPYQPTNDVD